MTIQRTGEADPITFSLLNGPPGVTATFSPNTTSASATLMSLNVGLSASVGKANLEIQGIGPTGASSTALPFAVQAPNSLLVVDDDLSLNNGPGRPLDSSPSDDLFKNLLAGGSDLYVVPWVRGVELDGPTFEQIKYYKKLIWYSGESHAPSYAATSSPGLNSFDESVLRAFLDQGDREVVVFSTVYPGKSGSWSWESVTGSWMTNYLGLKGVARNITSGAVFDVTGVGPLAGILMTQGVDSPIASLAQGLNPAAGTDVLLTARFNPDGSGVVDVPLAIGRKNVGLAGTSKIILVAFSFENLTDVNAPNTKASIFSRLLAY